jgi:hypothetical protein
MARDRPWSRLAHAEWSSAAVALMSLLPPELCTLIGDANRAAVERECAPTASRAERVVAEMHAAFECVGGFGYEPAPPLRTSDFRMSASCACCRQWPWKCVCVPTNHICTWSSGFDPWLRRSKLRAGPQF